MKNQKPPMSLFQGQAQKMKLVSKEFSTTDGPGREEHLTITADGDFSLSHYYFSKTGLKRLSYKKNEKIWQERAELALNYLSHWFSLSHEPSDVQGEGIWELVLTNREGESFSYSGPLSKKVDGAYYRLSCLLEDTLDCEYEGDRENFLAFTGYRSLEDENIRRITVDYRRRISVKPLFLTNKPLEEVQMDYSEQLIVDGVNETVEQSQRSGSSCETYRKYHVKKGISSFLQELELEFLFVHIKERWEEKSLNLEKDASYTITLEFGEYKPLVIKGSFHKNGLPEDWSSWVDALKYHVEFDGNWEILDPSVYNRARRRSEDLVFCSVVFDDESKPRYYLTNDETLQVNDFVLVPVESDSQIVMAKIVNIEYFPEEKAPCPIEKVKSILRKISEEDMDMPAYSVSEPLAGKSPEKIRKILGTNPTEATLAKVYAQTANQMSWLFHQMIDEYTLWFTPRYKEWATLEQELSERIIEILKKEDSGKSHDQKKGGTRPHYTIYTLMERNGYKHICCWWFKQGTPLGKKGSGGGKTLR